MKSETANRKSRKIIRNTVAIILGIIVLGGALFYVLNTQLHTNIKCPDGMVAVPEHSGINTRNC